MDKITAIILAGGGSRRMGQDKALLMYRGKPLVQHVYDQLNGLFPEIILSANDPEKFQFLDVKVVPDRLTDQGPLVAIASALAESTTEYNFVIACDIPELDFALFDQLLQAVKGHECAVPMTGLGRYEPLFGVYRKSMTPHLERLIENGVRAMKEALGHCRTGLVPIDDDRLKNLNTPEDYAAACDANDAGATNAAS